MGLDGCAADHASPAHAGDFLAPAAPELVESYQRLADVFHEVLAEQSLDALLVRIADALGDLIPHDTLTIYEADETQRVLTAVFARDEYADEIMATKIGFDEGITGWAARRREPALVNQAHLDPRVRFVPGTPIDPEALISIPLISRARIKGVLNIYRIGEDGFFTADEFELAKRFADAAALALDNAEIRARLEHQAQTDSLTGLFNHRSFHERLLTRAAGGEPDAQAGRRADARHRRLQARQRRARPRRRRRAALRARRHAARLRAAGRRRLPARRRGVRRDHALLRRRGRGARRRAARRAARRSSSSRRRRPHGLDRARARSEHAMNPRELDRLRRGGDDDREGARQEQDRPLRRRGERAAGRAAAERDVRSIAHMKMLQSLGGKLNRLNDVREIGDGSRPSSAR